MARYLVCITGASGAIYALRLLSALASRGVILHVVCSSWGARVLLEETGRSLGYWLGKLRAEGGPRGSQAVIKVHAPDDFSAPVASGSFRLDGMAVAPCSIGTLGSLASGTCQNLIHRAGAVALKEGWPLVIVPRETPLSLVTIRSFETLTLAGATILPASPGFYTKPESIESLVDTVVHRVMDRLGLPAGSTPRWGDQVDRG